MKFLYIFIIIFLNNTIMSDLQNHFNKFIEELEKKTEDFPKETIIQKKSNKLSKTGVQQASKRINSTFSEFSN